LQTKPIQGIQGVYEARVDQNYRAASRWYCPYEDCRETRSGSKESLIVPAFTLISVSSEKKDR
jgi:hypothetical protein